MPDAIVLNERVMTAAEKRAALLGLVSKMAEMFELPLTLRAVIPQLLKGVKTENIDATLDGLVNGLDGFADAVAVIRDGDAAQLENVNRALFAK